MNMSYDEATDSGGSRDSKARQVAGGYGARPGCQLVPGHSPRAKPGKAATAS